MLLLVAVGQFLGMTLWFSATAAAPAIAADLSLSGPGAAWLTMAVQAGFVAGTLTSALLNLADVLNPRRLFAAGCLAGALANGMIPFAGNAATVIALRLATGFALACVYPPGLKIAAGWFLERRGTALGVVVGALTIGSAFPHLLAWGAAAVPWRMLMWVSSALALAGGIVGCQPRREERRQQEDDDDDGAGRGRVVLLEAQPDLTHVCLSRSGSGDLRTRTGGPRAG